MRISCQSQFGWKMGIHCDFLELLLVAWNDSELNVKNEVRKFRVKLLPEGFGQTMDVLCQAPLLTNRDRGKKYLTPITETAPHGRRIDGAKEPPIGLEDMLLLALKCILPATERPAGHSNSI